MPLDSTVRHLHKLESITVVKYNKKANKLIPVLISTGFVRKLHSYVSDTNIISIGHQQNFVFQFLIFWSWIKLKQTKRDA